VLLEFLKAEKYVFTNPTITPFLIKDIIISSQFINFKNGRGCMHEIDLDWFNDSFDDYDDDDDDFDNFGMDKDELDELKNVKIESKPFYFSIESKSNVDVLLFGIVYLRSEYISQKLFKKYSGNIYDGPYEEEFHIVRTSDVDHVIVFLTPFHDDDIVKPRCNLQYICHDDDDNDEYPYFDDYNSLDSLDDFFEKQFCGEE
jgi:hypothetical protein